MNVSLSIIVPILNERQLIGVFLEHLLSLNGCENAEIIVVDGGSSDGCRDIVSRFPVRLIESPRGRSQQMNAGARYASGKYLLFVHADSRLPADGIQQILGNLKQARCAGSFRLAFASGNRALKLFAWCTRFDLSLFRFGDQGLFVSRQLFHQVGGFDESLSLMEDQDIVRRLRKCAEFKILPQSIKTSARKYEAHGVFYTQLTFTLIVLLYYLGVSQNVLTRLYRSAFYVKHNPQKGAH